MALRIHCANPVSSILAAIMLLASQHVQADADGKPIWNDCSLLSALTERARCLDPSVMRAEAEQKYILDLTDPGWRAAIQKEGDRDSHYFADQARLREESAAKRCWEDRELKATDTTKLKCLEQVYREETADRLSSRIAARSLRESHRVLVTADPAEQRVCKLAMSVRQDFIKRRYPTVDNVPEDVFDYVAHDPPEVKIVPRSKFANITQIGKPTIELVLKPGAEPAKVYRHTAAYTHYQYSWFITLVSNKNQPAFTQAAIPKSDASETTLWEDYVLTMAAWPELAGPFEPTPDPLLHRKGAGSKAAHLIYDASNTQAFRGWYTNQEVVTVDGVAYIRATNVNTDAAGPDVALFSFGEGGALNLLCWEQFAKPASPFFGPSN